MSLSARITPSMNTVCVFGISYDYGRSPSIWFIDNYVCNYNSILGNWTHQNIVSVIGMPMDRTKAQLTGFIRLQAALQTPVGMYIFSTNNRFEISHRFWELKSMRFCISPVLHRKYHDQLHDDVIKWIHFPRCCPFVRGIHRGHKGEWRGALMFSLIFAWINSWINNREAGDLRRHRVHFDVIVMNMSRKRQLPRANLFLGK